MRPILQLMERGPVTQAGCGSGHPATLHHNRLSRCFPEPDAALVGRLSNPPAHDDASSSLGAFSGSRYPATRAARWTCGGGRVIGLRTPSAITASWGEDKRDISARPGRP